ncbi:MAG: S1C family serine protease [Bacillaceae bacterium]
MTRERTKNKSNKKGYFFTGIAGAVIGALTITLATPYLTNLDSDITPNTSQTQQTTTPKNVTVVNKEDVASVIQQVKTAVVGVNNYQNTNNFMMESQQQVGSGSGVIYKKVGNKALVVTNHHVVSGAQKLDVKLDNGKRVEAKLVGSDSLMDLAVLEIPADDVEYIATLGNSDNVRVGDTAIAIGNPLGFLEGTVTQGIISSKEREIPMDVDGDGQTDWEAQVLQTDAAINSGNSGGALISADGEVIGINSSKIASESVEGIGFAIPMNLAKPILESIEKYGEVKRPVMGVKLISLEDIPSFNLQSTLKLPESVTTGAVVAGVTTGSPAQAAGLKEYDVIVALDDTAIQNVLQFKKYLYTNKEPGDKVKITFYRNGKKQTTTASLTTDNIN